MTTQRNKQMNEVRKSSQNLSNNVSKVDVKVRNMKGKFRTMAEIFIQEIKTVKKNHTKCVKQSQLKRKEERKKGKKKERKKERKEGRKEE